MSGSSSQLRIQVGVWCGGDAWRWAIRVVQAPVAQVIESWATGCRCGMNQGVGSETAAPKMSELPNVAGQACCGAGLATEVPVRSDSRHASMAAQSAALRVSFQTPTRSEEHTSELQSQSNLVC